MGNNQGKCISVQLTKRAVTEERIADMSKRYSDESCHTTETPYWTRQTYQTPTPN
jgi:hypothetical protein